MGAWEFNCGACRRRGFDVSSPPSFVKPTSIASAVGRARASERRDKGRVDSCVALVAQEPFLLSPHESTRNKRVSPRVWKAARASSAAIRSNRPSPLRLLGARCVGPRAVPSVTCGKARLIPSARNQPENRLSFWGRAKMHLPRISLKDDTHAISTRRVENAARPFSKSGTDQHTMDAEVEQRKFFHSFAAPRVPRWMLNSYKNVTAVRTKRSTSCDCLQRVSGTNDVAQTPSSVNPSHFQGSLFESRWLKTQRQRRTRPKSCTTSRRNHLAILAATLEATFARTFALVGRLCGESEIGPPASRWWWWREW